MRAGRITRSSNIYINFLTLEERQAKRTCKIISLISKKCGQTSPGLRCKSHIVVIKIKSYLVRKFTASLRIHLITRERSQTKLVSLMILHSFKTCLFYHNLLDNSPKHANSKLLSDASPFCLSI